MSVGFDYQYSVLNSLNQRIEIVSNEVYTPPSTGATYQVKIMVGSKLGKHNITKQMSESKELRSSPQATAPVLV